MGDDYRSPIGHARTPIQQSMTRVGRDYRHYEMHGMMLGIILDVYPSDDERNRTAHQSTTRRGFYHEAKVLLVNTNASANVTVDHVVICPSMHTGLDDYYEHLPRGSSNRVDGEAVSNSGAHVDPYDLDGDWCVVGFLGSSLDQPFIVTWWPHPRNGYDAATSGNGNADSAGDPQALEQHNRYFRRINGIEQVITGTGDVYLSTTYANSTLQFSNEAEPTRGRWPRAENEDVGGSILVEVKPSQTLELAWDPQIDGAGVLRGNEVELPQTNPKAQTSNATAQSREEMYVKIARDELKVTSPEAISMTSGSRITIVCDEEISINASNLLKLTSDEVVIAGNSNGVTVGGSQVVLGPAATDQAPTGPGKVELTSTGITLGEGAVDAVIKGTTLDTAWQAISTTLGNIAPPTDIATIITAVKGNTTAITALAAALSSALSPTTKTS